MDFFLKNLRQTLEAIIKLKASKISIIDTKRIRRCYNVKPSNRSQINFIWRTLKYLEGVGVLEQNGSTTTKSYKIKVKKKIDIENILSQAKINRMNEK